MAMMVLQSKISKFSELTNASRNALPWLPGSSWLMIQSILIPLTLTGWFLNVDFLEVSSCASFLKYSLSTYEQPVGRMQIMSSLYASFTFKVYLFCIWIEQKARPSMYVIKPYCSTKFGKISLIVSLAFADDLAIYLSRMFMHRLLPAIQAKWSGVNF